METSRNWMFTINNYSSFEEPQSWNVKFLVYQEETGAEGTRHLQGYVMFPKNMRLSAVKKIHSKAHWEPRRGTHEQAVAYCTKQETRTGLQYTGGTAPDQGHRTDLDHVAACALVHPLSVVASSFPSQFIRYHRGIQAFKTVMTKARSWLTDLIIYWGPPRTGKSTHVEDLWPDAYWLPKPASSTVWWSGYEGQDTVVIDEFYGWLPIDFMCRLIDRFPMTVETKGGSVPMLARRVVITSNKSPWEWWNVPNLHGMERRLAESFMFELTEVHPPTEHRNKRPVPATYYGAQ
jgi:hypothetical protein